MQTAAAPIFPRSIEPARLRRRSRKQPSPIACPVCESHRISVIDSRLSRGTIRRRRACENCNHRWTTFEVSEDIVLSMLKAARCIETLRTVGGQVNELANILDALSLLPDATDE